MERNFLLRSTAAFLLLFTTGIIVFCGSLQTHKTGSHFEAGGDSHPRKGSSATGSLEVVLPTPSRLSYAGRDDQIGSNIRVPVVLHLETQSRIHKGEARSLSPPDVWPTSVDRAEFFQIPGRHSQAFSVQSAAATSLGDNVLVQKSAPHTRPTTKMDTPRQSLFFATRILLKTVSSLTAFFNSTSSNRLVQAPMASFSDNPRAPLADPTASDGELSTARHGKSLVRDGSPTEMRPIATTPYDDVFGIVRNQYKHRRALLRDISPPGMWPVTSDDDDEFQLNRRRRLLSDDSAHSSSVTAANSDRHRYQKQRRALLRDISPPGMWPITSDDDEFEFFRRRALLSQSWPQSSSSAAATTSDGYQKHRRALRDISPLGMWPITSDDDELQVARRRALLSHNSPQSPSAAANSDRMQKHRRALLRDVSPPGMWPVTSDDDEKFEVTRRRALLSDDLPLSSVASASDRYPYQKQRRALLRDISPPGMWPITSDDDEEFSVHRRRALLSDDEDSTNPPSATATTSGRHQNHRRALLRDISPPGMWPITSDDDEFQVARRRRLLSDDSAPSSSAMASTGMWRTADD